MERTSKEAASVALADRVHRVAVHGLPEAERRYTLHCWDDHVRRCAADNGPLMFWACLASSLGSHLRYRAFAGPPSGIAPGLFFLAIAAGAVGFVLSPTRQVDRASHVLIGLGCGALAAVLIAFPQNQPRRMLSASGALLACAVAKYIESAAGAALHWADHILMVAAVLAGFGSIALFACGFGDDTNHYALRSLGMTLLSISGGVLAVGQAVWLPLVTTPSHRPSVAISGIGAAFISVTLWRLRSPADADLRTAGSNA